MAIVRTDRQSGDWFLAHKGWAEDAGLSWEARGLLAYLFTKPDDWEVRMGDLINSGPCKKHKLRRIMNELEEAGYADREKKRQDDGTFTWITTISERPPPKGSRVDGVHDGRSRGSTKEGSSTKEGKEGSSGSADAPACEPASPSMPEDLLPLYDTYQPEIEEHLDQLTPVEDADRLVMRLWGQSSISNTTMRLATNHEWPYFVSGVVIAANEAKNPNPRYLDTLLEALTDLDEQTSEDPTIDEQQSNLQRLWNAAKDA